MTPLISQFFNLNFLAGFCYLVHLCGQVKRDESGVSDIHSIEYQADFVLPSLVVVVTTSG